jgi:lysophospholipase
MITPDGAKIRTGFWPSLKNYPNDSYKNIILLQGRASFIEKFHEVIPGLTERDYNVWSFDWRGQGLSSRLLENQHKGYVDSYETYLKDLHQFITEVVNPTANKIYILLGQSMGAHIALRYLEEFENVFSGAMLISPMIRIKTGFFPYSLAKALSYFYTQIGLGDHYVPGHSDFTPTLGEFEGNYLTGNLARYNVHRELQNNNLPLVIGGVTYGWLKATFNSIEAIVNPHKLKKVQIPVFIIESENDKVVDNEVLPGIVKYLPQGIIKTYPHAQHQIFMESDEVFNIFWHDLEAFTEHLLLLKSYFPLAHPSLPASALPLPLKSSS